MTNKGLIFRCVDVYVFFHRKKSAPLVPEDSKMHTSSSIANSQRMQTEINESGTRAKIRI